MKAKWRRVRKPYGTLEGKARNLFTIEKTVLRGGVSFQKKPRACGKTRQCGVQEALEKIIYSFYGVFFEHVTGHPFSGQNSHLQIRDV